MARYGAQFGPDVTFLGVRRCDIGDAASYAGADVVILGAPFDGVLGGDHSIAFADARGVAEVLGYGRVSMIHFDAHADTGDIEFGSL